MYINIPSNFPRLSPISSFSIFFLNMDFEQKIRNELSQKNKEIVRLEEEIKRLKEEASQHKGEISQNKGEIKRLKEEIKRHEEVIKTLEEKVTKLTVDNAESDARINILAVYRDPIGKFKTTITNKVRQRSSEITA